MPHNDFWIYLIEWNNCVRVRYIIQREEYKHSGESVWWWSSVFGWNFDWNIVVSVSWEKRYCLSLIQSSRPTRWQASTSRAKYSLDCKHFKTQESKIRVNLSKNWQAVDVYLPARQKYASWIHPKSKIEQFVLQHVAHGHRTNRTSERIYSQLIIIQQVVEIISRNWSLFFDTVCVCVCVCTVRDVKRRA